MFENPIILVVIVVAIALLAGAFFIQKNKQSGNGGRGRSSSGRGRDVEDDDDDEEEDDDDEEDGAEDEHWGSSGTTANSRVDDTKVSVQEVDPLNEFNVYKQFGYYEKAAESLSVYMKNYPDKVTPKLVAELLNLWLESKKVDQLSDSLTQYKSAFPNEILADYIKKGLALDENHLGLRVLAESCLGWGVKKTGHLLLQNALKHWARKKNLRKCQNLHHANRWLWVKQLWAKSVVKSKVLCYRLWNLSKV